MNARERGGVANRKEFNVVDYIIQYLMPSIGGRFELALFSTAENVPEAHVRFNYKTGSLKLSVSKLVWNKAKFNLPEARYVLAHELGHIFMHRHDRLAFSENNQSTLISLPEEDRAEAQANLFADVFLVYDDSVQDYTCSKKIENDFRVPPGCARRRLLFVEDERRRNHTGELLGDPCPRCNSMMLVRGKDLTKCKLCNFEISNLF